MSLIQQRIHVLNLTPEQELLLEQLRNLQRALSKNSIERYQRLNPFFEDILSWHERSEIWTNESDQNITLYNSSTIIGNVQIGKHTWVGPFTMLDGSGGLTIGDYCSISSGVQILTHDTVKWALSGGLVQPERSPTTIGSRCYIGTNAIVLRGLRIGDQSVIGAGAVVTKDVGANQIVAGVPARHVGNVILEDGVISLNFFEK
jgi:acetyltransferase-like isoleucine patch superfamily enzyme